MATTKEYKNYILEQLDLLDNIVCKNMMGEYLLYYKGVLIGGIYDNRLLLKIVNTNKKYRLKESIPYKGAKKMYLVQNVDNKEILRDIVFDTYNWLIK
ncbi:MAG: TfoX/Sxy family protein [bacterium]|nr:TfoX/Sxy family protein [bacterium]